jgi:Tfp pilus assembly protein PilO
MQRFIIPVILIGIAVTLFFMLANPIYSDISTLQTQVASYSEALDNSKALESERDKLTDKYNTINPDNLAKVVKLLPDNVDNIRLILEIEQIAMPYNMVLKDVKYNVSSTSTASATTVVQGGVTAQTASTNKNYGVFNLEFSTTGSYNNFINFTKDLESNLRIVDIASISFSSDTNTNTKNGSGEVYTYDFKIKTYYLKN